MMPSDSSRSFVRLCKTYLVVSSTNPGRRYYMRNIFQEKVHVPNEVAKALIVRKLIIPLLIAIGEERDYALDILDLDYIVVVLKNYSKDIIQVMTSGQSYPLQDTFRAFFLGESVRVVRLYVYLIFTYVLYVIYVYYQCTYCVHPYHNFHSN